MPVPRESSSIHQITTDMVKGRPKAADVLGRFFAFAAGTILVAHNAPFDAGMVGLELTRLRLPAPQNPILDSLKAARRIYPGGAHSLDALIGLVGLPQPDARHRAFGDAELVRHLVRRMVESLGGDERPLAALVEHAGPVDSLDKYLLPAPRLPPALQYLEEACRAGTKASVHLDGAGARKAQRVVLPRVCYEWSGVGYLEAFCPEEGQLRTFRLDKIVKAEPGASSGFLF
ncbi:MAG: WYL domain-containing protein [Planctomycetes bacterium]|nr:WYL domain-containing protein [Planctomycetota bacterium]